MKKFRKHHLLTILEGFEETSAPLDLFLNKYFRANKSIGSTDRKEICEPLYYLIRWRGLIDYQLKKPITWDDRIEFAIGDQKLLQESAPSHVKVSFPKELFDRFVASLGEAKATELCLASNNTAPLTIRINPAKTTREALLKAWKQEYPVSPCSKSPLGIVFHRRYNFFTMPEFTKGLFEVQDEASQIAAMRIKAKPGQHILDYCSGSGGKSLAFAHQMDKRGVIYLHDIRPRALIEAKKRLKRAGVQNAQIVDTKTLKKARFQKKMDWLLLDVPCSGTGTLRRNPDMKWKITGERIDELKKVQREIFAKALPFLKPGGHIVYATCSVLPEENEEQIAYFMETYGLEKAATSFHSFPKENGMDGFFSATLCAKN
jgi:16S rRNA (cytosine967-C5)-methyltransferase